VTVPPIWHRSILFDFHAYRPICMCPGTQYVQQQRTVLLPSVADDWDVDLQGYQRNSHTGSSCMLMFWVYFQDMKTRRLNVVHQLQELNDSCDPILSLMTDDELMKKMETMRDSRTLMNFLQDELGVRSLY